MDIINNMNGIFSWLFVGGGYDMRWLGVPATIMAILLILVGAIWFLQDINEKRKEAKKNGKS